MSMSMLSMLYLLIKMFFLTFFSFLHNELKHFKMPLYYFVYLLFKCLKLVIKKL